MIVHVSRRQLGRFAVFIILVAAAVYVVYQTMPQFLATGRKVDSVPAAAPPAVRPIATPGPPIMPAAPIVPPALALPTAAAPEVNFFADFRLVRDRARGEQREMLEALMAQSGLTEDTRSTLNNQYLSLSRILGIEIQLEGLIRAAGFADAVVFLTDNFAQVVVQAAELTSGQAARIADLVGQATGVKSHRITISLYPGGAGAGTGAGVGAATPSKP